MGQVFTDDRFIFDDEYGWTAGRLVHHDPLVVGRIRAGYGTMSIMGTPIADRTYKGPGVPNGIRGFCKGLTGSWAMRFQGVITGLNSF